MDGEVRSQPTLGYTPGTTLVAAATVTTAAALGAIAVSSPKHAMYALLAIGFVAVAACTPSLGDRALRTASPFPSISRVSRRRWNACQACGRAHRDRLGERPFSPVADGYRCFHSIGPLLFWAIVTFLVFGAVSTLWATDPSQMRTYSGTHPVDRRTTGRSPTRRPRHTPASERS